MIGITGQFSVNILSRDQQTLCARLSSPGYHKLSATDWIPSRYGGVRLTGSLTDLDCAIEAVHASGDHDIVVGRVLDLALNPPNEPLVYFDRRFPAWLSQTPPGTRKPIGSTGALVSHRWTLATLVMIFRAVALVLQHLSVGRAYKGVGDPACDLDWIGRAEAEHDVAESAVDRCADRGAGCRWAGRRRRAERWIG